MAFTKQTVSPGDTITSAWGNHIQTQYEEVVGTADNQVTPIKALQLDVHARSLEVNRTGGQLSSVVHKAGEATVKTCTLARVGGQVSGATVVAGGKTITITLNRTGGQVTSVTRSVV